MTTETTHFTGRIQVTRVTKTEVPAKSDYNNHTPARTDRNTVEELDVTVRGADVAEVTAKLNRAITLLDVEAPTNNSGCLAGCA